MDLKILSQLIKKLLENNDRVSLPGIGSFVAEIAPAFFSEDGISINPPSRKLAFKTSEIWNDGLIEKYYAEKFKINPTKATKELDVFFAELKAKADAKKSIIFPEIGKLRSTLEGNLYFITDEDADFNTGLVGLDSISVRDLSKISKKEVTPKKRVALKANVARKEDAPVKVLRRVMPEIVHEQEADSTEKVLFVLEKNDDLEALTTGDLRSRASEPKAKKRRTRTEVFLNLFVALLILILAVLIFREEIASLVETLLYTPSELEFLRQLETNSLD